MRTTPKHSRDKAPAKPAIMPARSSFTPEEREAMRQVDRGRLKDEYGEARVHRPELFNTPHEL